MVFNKSQTCVWSISIHCDTRSYFTTAMYLKNIYKNVVIFSKPNSFKSAIEIGNIDTFWSIKSGLLPGDAFYDSIGYSNWLGYY